MTEMEAVRTPKEFRDFFAEVFAMMDAEPVSRKFRVSSDGLEIDFAGGNPVFRIGAQAVDADFRGRWLPEHPVPVKLSGQSVFSFVPTTGNRVKVRIK